MADGREILIMFSRVADDVPDVRNAVPYERRTDISSFMRSNFDMMWEMAGPPW